MKQSCTCTVRLAQCLLCMCRSPHHTSWLLRLHQPWLAQQTHSPVTLCCFELAASHQHCQHGRGPTSWSEKPRPYILRCDLPSAKSVCSFPAAASSGQYDCTNTWLGACPAQGLTQHQRIASDGEPQEVPANHCVSSAAALRRMSVILSSMPSPRE